MNGRTGKVQLPKLLSYCGPAVIGFLIVIGILTGLLPVQVRTAALVLPLPLGVLLGIILYFRLAHEVVQYDDNGFTVTRGKGAPKSYKWDQFSGLSLFADSKGGVSLRMYFQPDGEHVDLPATRNGIDPYSLRNALQSRYAKT